jgi:hypothetical protein
MIEKNDLYLAHPFKQKIWMARNAKNVSARNRHDLRIPRDAPINLLRSGGKS